MMDPQRCWINCQITRKMGGANPSRSRSASGGELDSDAPHQTRLNEVTCSKEEEEGQKEGWMGRREGRERRTRSPGLMTLISLIRHFNEAAVWRHTNTLLLLLLRLCCVPPHIKAAISVPPSFAGTPERTFFILFSPFGSTRPSAKEPVEKCF